MIAVSGNFFIGYQKIRKKHTKEDQICTFDHFLCIESQHGWDYAKQNATSVFLVFPLCCLSNMKSALNIEPAASGENGYKCICKYIYDLITCIHCM